MGSEKRERKKTNQAARRAALEAARKKAEQRARVRRLVVGGVGIAAIVVVLALVLSRVNKKKDDTDVATGDTTTSVAAEAKPLATIAPVAEGKSITGDTPCPKADGSEARASKFEKAPPTCIDPKKKYVATFDTGAGTIKVDLDTAATPNTVNNFVVLSRYHFYDGSSFQRSDTSIDIIQGGSPGTQSISDPGPGYTIKDEPTFTTDPATGGLKGPYKYADGDLVMARSQGADSSGAQYFFAAGDKVSALDAQGTYIKFGKVSEGLDVLHKVLASHVECPPDSASCLGGAPQPPVAITKITIAES